MHVNTFHTEILWKTLKCVEAFVTKKVLENCFDGYRDVSSGARQQVAAAISWETFKCNEYHLSEHYFL
jgi:hypothetical protein